MSIEFPLVKRRLNVTEVSMSANKALDRPGLVCGYTDNLSPLTQLQVDVTVRQSHLLELSITSCSIIREI